MMIDFDIDDGDDDDYDDVDDIDDDNATTMMIIWYDFDDDDNDNEDDDEPCIDEFPLSALVVFPLHCCSRHCSPFHLLIDLASIWPVQERVQSLSLSSPLTGIFPQRYKLYPS